MCLYPNVNGNGTPCTNMNSGTDLLFKKSGSLNFIFTLVIFKANSKFNLSKKNSSTSSLNTYIG